MTDMNNTLLALQVMNGAKMYEVRIAGSQQMYSYKASAEYVSGDAVLVQTKQTFVAGIVVREVVDFDYTFAAEWKWILFKIENPEVLSEKMDEMDRAAKRKMMQAQALNSAKQMLEASGLTLSDMKILLNAPGVTE